MIVKNCIDTETLLTEIKIERKRFLKDTFCKCLMLLFSTYYFLHYTSQIQKAALSSPWLLRYTFSCVLISGFIVLYSLCYIVFDCQRLFIYYYRKKNGAGIIQLARSFLSIDKSVDNWIMTLNEKNILDFQLLLVNGKEFLEVTLKDEESHCIPLTDVYYAPDYAPEDRVYMLFIEQTGISLRVPVSMKGEIYEHRK